LVQSDSAPDLLVSTERLGWPPKPTGWRRFSLGEKQDRLVYDDRPSEPSATCHLQRNEREAALCGYQWEQLVLIPGTPRWSDLHPMLRCSECSKAAGILKEDPTGRDYRYRWD
jgi:hypothetical protein